MVSAVLAAALFASEQEIATVQTVVSGGLIIASGLLDLMGVHPLETGNKWRNPWAAMDALANDVPDHPYARLEKGALRESMEQVVAFLDDEGLPYLKDGENNSEMITPLGTSKYSYYIP